MRTYDLIVIGAGSGNMLFTPELAGLKAAIVEPDRFGGTCLNRGCIPSKMLVVAADAVRAITHAERLGVHGHLEHVDWPAIRSRVFGRLDPLHERAVRYRRSSGVDVYTDAARFIAPRVVQVGDETLSAERVVIAAGSRPDVPAIPGLDTVRFHTSDTIMRIDKVPASMTVLGGGFIAAEMGHVFEAFGSAVTIVQRGPRLLMAEDEEISQRFTAVAAERFNIHLSSTVRSVSPTANGIATTIDTPTGQSIVESEVLLVATGRRPNTDQLDPAAGGLTLDAHGHVITDSTYRTSVPGVWAIGDAANHFQLKHIANAEVRTVAYNLMHPGAERQLDATSAPHAVFTDPQIAGVGITEAQAQQGRVSYITATRDYADTAYGWALEDTTSFIKVIADAESRLLLGAHIIGPQAATLIQPLLQAMTLGQTADQLAREVLYIHPALTEVLEQVLLSLPGKQPVPVTRNSLWRKRK